jgi:hypothetical protein
LVRSWLHSLCKVKSSLCLGHQGLALCQQTVHVVKGLFGPQAIDQRGLAQPVRSADQVGALPGGVLRLADIGQQGPLMLQ